MKRKDYRCWTEIDLDAMLENFRLIRKRLPEKTEIAAVVKADAYGHGAAETAKLLENDADCFAVATADEATELRRNGIKNKILILGHILPCDFEEMINENVELAISDVEEAVILSETCKKLGKTAKIHVTVDTGMGRIGFVPSENAVEEIARISKMYGLEIVGIFSHFAKADTEDRAFTEAQMAKFDEFTEELAEKGIKPPRHLYNSAAVIDLSPKYEAVREGISIYGLSPSDKTPSEKLGKIKAVMTFKSRIMHIKTVPAGTPISYGSTFVTEKETKIATVGAGYADGVNRALSNRWSVTVNGKKAPIIGRICMDQFMIDVSDVENVKKYDEVIIFGDGENETSTADEAANVAGTIGYEIICGINKRVPRVYIRNKEIEKIKTLI